LHSAQQAAEKFMKNNPDHQMEAYRCREKQEFYHIGHSNPKHYSSVTLGNVDKRYMFKFVFSNGDIYLCVTRKNMKLPVVSQLADYLFKKDTIVLARRTSFDEYYSCIDDRMWDDIHGLDCKWVWAAHSFKYLKADNRMKAEFNLREVMKLAWDRITSDDLCSIIGEDYFRTQAVESLEIQNIEKEEIKEEVQPTIQKETNMKEQQGEKYFMTSGTKKAASNPRAKTTYKYHTKKDCWAMIKSDSTCDIVTLDPAVDVELVKKMRLCGICGGTHRGRLNHDRVAEKQASKSNVALELMLPIELTDKIIINGVEYIRASAVTPPKPVGQLILDGVMYDVTCNK
jgi:hypothetical protein